MARPKQPCSRDCPSREIGCHGRCERYLAYEAEKKAFYAEKRLTIDGYPPNDQMMKNVNRNAMQRRKGTSSVLKGE